MSAKKPPFDPEKLYQRALSFHHEGKLKEAEGLYKTLLEFFPNQVGVITPLATLLLQMGRHQEGITQLRKSLSLNPNQAGALYNLGVELQKKGDLEESLQCYQQALKLEPQNINAWLNHGNALKDLQRHQEAIKSFDQAIKLNPNMAAIYWNKALTQISLGNYEDGWSLYEWGWPAGERGKQRNFTQPTWLGTDSIAGKSLLIYPEQGLGDFIQFCRYVPMLEALGAKGILVVPKPLLELMRSLEGNFTIVEDGESLPYFDMVCPIMSLPLAFKTTLKNVPQNIPYLFAEQNKQTEWRNKLGKKTKLRIGLVWSGSLTNKIDLNPASRRYIPLSELKPLLELPHEFHVLQKEFRDEDQALLPSIKQLHLHELTDFSSTAGLIQEMDLVISVCTSVAHLSGALGKETWVLLPHTADYRWLLDRDDTPWYPSLKLIRQNKIGCWSDALTQISNLISGYSLN
jgi:tetratricopeptide (TPR) repeat protein